MSKSAVKEVSTGDSTDRPLLGIAFVLFSTFAFSCLDTSIKWLILAGLSVFQLVFLRFSIHFLLSLLFFFRHGFDPKRFLCKRILLVIIRSVFLILTTLMNFISLKYLPLTLTATIFFSSPIVVCVLAGPILGERVGIYRWSAIILGFIGILIAMRPFDADFHWATITAFGAATFFALFIIYTRKLSGSVSPEVLQLYGSLAGTIMIAPLAIWQWETQDIESYWPLIILLGFFGWLGHEFVIRAYKYATASSLSPFNYSIIIYLTIWSIFIFDDWPDFGTVLGATIIACSGLFIWLREKRLAALKTQAAQTQAAQNSVRLNF